MALNKSRLVLCPKAATAAQAGKRLGKCLMLKVSARTLVASASAIQQSVEHEVSDLPGPTAWPLVGNFLTYIKKENQGRLHEVLADQHKRYGVIYKEKLGPKTNVHISDPSLIEQVLRNQGKHPERTSFNSWKMYRHLTGESLGILTTDGEEWHRYRSILSKRLLKPKMAMDYGDVMNEVITDMVQRLRHVRDVEGNGVIVPSLPFHFYLWSMESVGTVLFECRMGCLEAVIPELVQQFIEAIEEMNVSSLPLMIGEKVHKALNTKHWQKHRQAWDRLFVIAKHYVDGRLHEVKQLLNANKDVDVKHMGNVLTYLLVTKELSVKEVYANITEMLLAGIDTTSNVMSFIMYLLSQNTSAQNKLYSEVTSVLQGRIPTVEDLANMPYLKCVVKESLRLYPTITMNVRILEEDIVLSGYRIPKETMLVLNHYAAGHDERYFKNPESFEPERWDRKTSQNLQPFTCLPFGFGTRSCLGRRIAELELNLAITRIMQQFELRPHEGFKLQPFLRTALSPGKEVPVEFHDR